jgi:pyruvate kinase
VITSNPTKIIATLGPASADEAVLTAMVEAGLDLVRLNFSHGTPADHARAFDLVTRVAARLQTHLGVIADLQGPKIRTGELQGHQPVCLATGAPFCITTEPCPGTAERVATTYANLPQDVRAGDRMLLDDGLMELRVETVTGPEVHCQVVTGGLLGEHKGLNLPGVAVSAPSLTTKDRDDARFALGLGVDYLALSFVRHPADVAALRELCQTLGRAVPIITKLEKPEALQHLGEIIAASDAVMVARGDLGVELSPEEVPVWQKRIIAECARAAIPVITATQMLESMREHPRPTRAEASDVANAIFDGTDAVMLSAETAIGQYPVESVAMMRRIATAAEAEQRRWRHQEWLARTEDGQLTIADAVSRAAVTVAEEVGARAIVAFTESGSTARLASKRRPQVPILACTPLVQTARRCSLYWGVTPVLVRTVNDTDEMIQLTAEEAKRLSLVQSGDQVVLTAGVPMGRPGTTNTIRVETIV